MYTFSSSSAHPCIVHDKNLKELGRLTYIKRTMQLQIVKCVNRTKFFPYHIISVCLINEENTNFKMFII